MNEPADPARYDDREFALILKKAAELQARDMGAPLGRGHTRREIEEIAAEAGIDERYVRQAFSVVAHRSDGLWSRLAGPPSQVQGTRMLPGALTPVAVSAVVDALQDEMKQPGSAREVLGGVEWTARDSFGPVQAVIRPMEGETRLQIGADRREAAAVLHILLPLGGLFAGVILGQTVSPLPVAATAALTTAGGLTAARLAWRSVVNRWHGRIERMLDRSVSAASADALPPVQDP